MPEELRELIVELNNIQMVRRPVDPAKNISRESFDTMAEYHRSLADAYDQYEKELIDYETQKASNNQRRKDLHRQIQDLIIDLTLSDRLPEKIKEKSFSYAYEESHSSGYEDVFNTMEELADLVEAAYFAGQKDPAAVS